jgi:ArsR family transcriptional regulator
MNLTANRPLDLLPDVFQALSDVRRLEILRLLTGGERCVCDLTEVVGAQQSLLSFHLKTLKNARLVQARRSGKWVYYSLNYETLRQLTGLLGSMIEGRDHSDACCCESLCCPSDANHLEKLRRQ